MVRTISRPCGSLSGSVKILPVATRKAGIHVKRLSLVLAVVVAGALVPGKLQTGVGVTGVDVSNWTGEVDWAAVSGDGAAFAFVHASEGLNYRNPLFAVQYGGAAEAGLIRGAYHFAQPHESGGAEQADFFVDNGGGWTADGQTLPGVLDVENNPYRNRNGLNHCYGLNRRQTVAWVTDFTRRYRLRTGRDAIIYTTTDWWRTCTGNSAVFGGNPLWLARWGDEPGELPAGWPRQSFWQSADKGELPGGQNSFNGTLPQLKMLAHPPPEIAAAGRAAGNTYVLTVLNTGKDPATGVTVTGRVFGGQRIVKAGPWCRFSGTAVRCTIARLASGERRRLTFVTKPVKAAKAVKAGKPSKPSEPARSYRTRGLTIKIGTVNLTMIPKSR